MTKILFKTDKPCEKNGCGDPDVDTVYYIDIGTSKLACIKGTLGLCAEHAREFEELFEKTYAHS